MFIERKIAGLVLRAASEFSVLAIVGPRQSGKTTLAQHLFPQHRYISLEDEDMLLSALADPRRFLNDMPTKQGMIIDEIQRAPVLLSYMQTIVDKAKNRGFFIVTGSQNFLVDEAITQTLAGRMAVFTLLPLSVAELEDAGMLPTSIETVLYKGMYPRAYAERVSIDTLYANYIRLYVERDVRQIKNVANLTTFKRFMRLCASRTGQVINLTSLGSDCGVNQSTVKAWLSLLEASYIIFLLYPYFNNYGKRLIKSPKLYFVDTGVLCSLLRIDSAQQIHEHYLRGGLVESYILGDLLKQQYNLDRQPSLYFWRDKTGHEIDGILDESTGVFPIEIKAGKTIVKDFFSNLIFWRQLTAESGQKGRAYVVYGGDKSVPWGEVDVVSWASAGKLLEAVLKK